jgi:hypothetical protein
MVKSITNKKSKIWTAVDILIFGMAIYLFLFVSQQPILLLVITIAVLYRIKWRSDKLIVDDNEIRINNWFTTTRTTLELKTIEKYAFNSEAIMGERLLLISENLVVAKIRLKNYSNMNELLNYLDTKLKDGHDGIAHQQP